MSGQTRALAAFVVGHKDIKVRVRLLASHVEVGREFREGSRRLAGLHIHGYFAPARRASAACVGTIALACDKRLAETVPHEVTHAVMHKLGGVHCSDDERLATAVGMLTARIVTRLRRLGVML